MGVLLPRTRYLFRSIATNTQHPSLSKGWGEESRATGRLPKSPLELPGPNDGVQHVAPALSRKLVTENGTRLTSALNAVSSKLTLRAMIAMNKPVAIDKRPAARVAEQFLRGNGLK